MTVNLLLDLDGTLLLNDFDAFVAAYLNALGKHMSNHVDADRMIQALLASTQKMTANIRPDRTLKETFDESFYPSLGLEESAVRDTIEGFYRDVYPTLRPPSSFSQEAVALVQESRRRGYRIGIATNPLFPRTAIEQRIAWAGISPSEPEIDLISSYETFHFAKPNPDYLTEFLAQMGWPDGPVVFVGNDPALDIAPAKKLGIRTFYITEESQKGQVPASGKLEDVLPWIDSCTPEELLPDYSSPHAMLSTLRSTPAALHTLARQLPAEAWNLCTIPGEWCLAEITCHLRDVDAEVNIPRFEKMLAEENPFLPSFNTDSWVNERQYISQDCSEALADFIKNRLRLLTLLENLQTEDWQRTARHAIFGPTQLGEIVNIIAGHDRLHLQQIYKTIP
jgi:FMN phosphatase YigB (HAD superfamily)